VDHHLVLGLPDTKVALAAFAADPELEHDRETDDEVSCWSWLRAEEPAAMGAGEAELGVRWIECCDDLADPPRRARLEVNLEAGELWMFASTERRLLDAERELRARFESILGPELDRDEDRPSVIRRWQRDRIEITLAELDEAA
jgi:hypothetical protein